VKTTPKNVTNKQPDQIKTRQLLFNFFREQILKTKYIALFAPLRPMQFLTLALQKDSD